MVEDFLRSKFFLGEVSDCFFLLVVFIVIFNKINVMNLGVMLFFLCFMIYKRL